MGKKKKEKQAIEDMNKVFEEIQEKSFNTGFLYDQENEYIDDFPSKETSQIPEELTEDDSNLENATLDVNVDEFLKKSFASFSAKLPVKQDENTVDNIGDSYAEETPAISEEITDEANNSFETPTSAEYVEEKLTPSFNFDFLLNELPVEQDENTVDKLTELQEFDFQEAIRLNTDTAGVRSSLPTFSSESLEKKKTPLAYEVFEYIKENFDILASNEKNCLYVYNADTGCYNEMTVNSFGIFLSKVFGQSDAMPFLTGTVQKAVFHFLVNNHSLQVKPAFFDNQERFINVANGVVDLTTGKLFAHDSRYGFLTALTFDYDEDYALGDEVPKQFGEMLSQNFPDPEDELRFVQCLAYLISNRYSNKVAFYWLGKPHTGKSTYQRLLTGMVGENLVSNLPLRKLADRFSVATLAGKKLNFCSETGRAPIKNLDVFKALIGNDYIDAEFKGKDHFSFRAQTKCVFAGNSMLNIDSSISEDAIFDRFEFIKFKHPTKKKQQIPFFERKLLDEEGVQILSFLIRILRNWYQNGCRFVKTDISKELKKTFKHMSEESDIVELFVKDCCKLDSDENVSYKELFKAYVEYCKQNCCVALTQQAFVKQIIVLTGAEKRRLHPSKNLQYRGLAGIRLKKSVRDLLKKNNTASFDKLSHHII